MLRREYGVDEPSLPRKRKAPSRLEVGSGEAFTQVQQRISILNSTLSAWALFLMQSRTGLTNQGT